MTLGSRLSWLTNLRWALVLGIVTWSAWMILFETPQQCRDDVVAGEVVPVCEPLAINSTPVLVVAVALGVLLFPDVGALQVPGIVALRRDVAETRAAVAGVQTEVAGLRLQTLSVSGATATTHGPQVQIHNYLDRKAETARVIRDARASEEGQHSEGTSGESAVLAFRAGLIGLAGLLPEAVAGAAVIGLTTSDGLVVEPTHIPTDVPPYKVALAAEVVRASWPLQGVLMATGDLWVAAAPAWDDDGRPVGALAAVFPPPDPDAFEGDMFEEIAAAADLTARAYARLLLDVLRLGPVAPDPGRGHWESAQ